MFRSEAMSYFEVIIPRELSWECMNLFGRIGSIHFASAAAQQKRPFYRQLKRCDQCLDRLTRLEALLEANSIRTHLVHRSRQEYPRIGSAEIEKLVQQWTDPTIHENSIYQFDRIEQTVESIWSRHVDISKSMDSLTNKLRNYKDRALLLKAARSVLGARFFQNNKQAAEYDQDHSIDQFDCRCGIINKEDEMRLQRIVFRISRGLIYTRFSEIADVEEGRKRCVFMVLYPRSMQYLSGKLRTLAETFTSIVFDIPLNNSAYESELALTISKIEQYESLITISKLDKQTFLSALIEPYSSQCSLTRIEYLKAFTIKEKTIYQQLSLLNEFSNFVQGFAYVATQQCQRTIQEISALSKPNQPSVQMISRQSRRPPTFYKVNHFTCSAQQIVQTYGIARYQQANPGLFTCTTFPFLFGVMFGDVGHGMALLLFAVMLCLRQQEIATWRYMKPFVTHRYLLLLMGFFSLYCGFIYNEYLSCGLNLFGSCYRPLQVKPGQEVPRIGDCVYPFGVDPVWGIASNSLAFTNSLKMKIAVVIGVLHMSLGLVAKALNAVFFGSAVDFFVQFVPELIFLWALFGYMDVLIVMKWLTDWGLWSNTAPSIITTLIDMPLRFGKVELYMYPSQHTVQFWLVVLAIICIPWILIPKPLMISYAVKRKAKKQDTELSRLITDRSRSDSQSLQLIEQDIRGVSLNELVVHQLIETIEFILGCVSNTASYLRLWALSLAHSQLSEVFFEKTVQKPLIMGYSGIPLLVLNFVLLTLTTFLVLMCMDGMECFLHALRLHWVEFQNKFYKADGYTFEPFDVQKSIRSHLN